ncbi:MAG: hypothetical protein UX13_C0002G0013 [Candidatus Woesebacteria bacterium GW2011_GWB1_45_5]|uniref:YYY membrane protein n=1 Tax=Candidatus Woesebacteria bacterium GW2011_GWB1_45_5 TaxID=1618581 RepID=A0A0G1PZG2_9BACT|nr:MAG: hypothetical protein UX13_C0002G0013 [Candidatus Woesebacteria bacterium GW2011_GWB1_45_5]
MVKSGWMYPYGMGFWGANGHDGIWHIALAGSLARGSFEMPVFGGATLQNYHIGFDMLLAVLTRITSIPAVNLYFQILPVLFAFLIGYLVYEFVFLWQGSERPALLSTFFVYFGGSLGFLLGRGESTFWSQQAISTLINPPFALSLIFILLGLIFLLKKKKIPVVLCFGVLVQIKIYAGLLVLGSLLVAGIWEIFLGTLLVSLLLFLPFNRLSAGLLIFKPFWFLETMMSFGDRVGWTKFGEAMVNYKSGGVWLKAIPAYVAALAIFVIGNLGTRSVFLLRKVKKDSVNIFIYSIIGAGIVIPVFFLQRGTPWNTIQFFYYSLFFSGILAGVALSSVNRYILTAVILLTIPTSILTLRDVYVPGRPPAMLDRDELSALGFLSEQPEGVVLTYPFDAEKAKEAESSPPRPLYLYASTAYVSAFGKHPAFLEDEINLDITGYDWKSRRIEVENWYKEKDGAKAREFLRKNNIVYIYLLKDQKLPLNGAELSLTRAVENSSVTVYRVE